MPLVPEGMVIGESYLQMLQEYCVTGLRLQAHLDNKDFYFMQGRAHFANTVYYSFLNKTYASREFERRDSIEWLPDLSPVDFFCGMQLRMKYMQRGI
jgi:hypothetical protein